MQHIVSLIIPCYNGEKFLHRCLDCILAQTYKKNIELILVNDGSSDNTHEVVLFYQEKLKENLFDFKYIHQENTGVGGAVNAALKHFTGEFLALLDADDYMMPDSINKRANWLVEHPEYAMVLNSGYYVTDSDYFTSTRPFEKIDNFNENTAFEDILDGRLLSWSGSYMIRASVWLKRCPNREIYPSRAGQNMQMILPAVYHEKVGYIHEPLMRYLVQEHSLSHFSGDDSGLKNFEATYRYQDIYENVLAAICNENDKITMIQRIRVSSANTRLGIAARAQNQALMQSAIQELKDAGAYTLNARIIYHSQWNPPAAFFWRIVRKGKSILKISG